MKSQFILLACLLFFFSNLNAQTGSFSVSIPFNGSNRELACYVPKDYDSNHSYQLMVCLHGLGDNFTNYRNALIGSLNWSVLFPNTIFVCPDGGDDRNKDFYQPAGDEAFITETMKYAMGKYSIDSKKVILQGFSLGGRSALKYGLEHATEFSGLLLNTPAIQGLSDLLNDPASSLQFKYENAKNVPIYITVGEKDYTYNGTIGELVKKLKRSDARIQNLLVKGLGHSIPSKVIMKDCQAFFDQTGGFVLDADLFENLAPIYFCDKNLNFNVLVRNNGKTPIQSLDFDLYCGEDKKTEKWTGQLLPNEHTMVSLHYATAASGVQKLSIKLAAFNKQKADEDSTNNVLEQRIEVLGSKSISFLNEDFEEEELAYSIEDKGGMFGWYTDTDIKKSGNTSIGTFNTILVFNTLGYTESFTSPMMDISSFDYKELSFDLAFNYHKYTAPYVTTETVFTDTLEILISTDCGETFSSVYKKWGKELATASEPILNPLSILACLFEPKSDEWRKEVIDLTKYSQAKNAIIKFNCISGLGGSLNIDNINVGSNSAGINIPAEIDAFSLYPNPAQHLVNIELPIQGAFEVLIFNETGRKIYSMDYDNSNGVETIDVENLPNGFYVVEVKSGDYRGYKKLVIGN